MRATLLARTRDMLARSGYFLSADSGARPLSFDLAARRDDELLLVKVLTNVDGLTDAVAQELRVIAQFLDAARLRRIREERGLSLGDLAQAAGVSRRAIGMYEDGMGAMVEVAMRLEEFLDETLALPTNPFRSDAMPAAAAAATAPSANDII